MKVKMAELTLCVQSGALGRLAQSAVPMRTALRLKDILRGVDAALQNYEDERIALCKEYGDLNPETNNYDIAPEKHDEFQTKANELLEGDVEIPGDAFTPSSLLSSASFSANDLLQLDWLIQTVKAESAH